MVPPLLPDLTENGPAFTSSQEASLLPPIINGGVQCTQCNQPATATVVSADASLELTYQPRCYTHSQRVPGGLCDENTAKAAGIDRVSDCDKWGHLVIPFSLDLRRTQFCSKHPTRVAKHVAIRAPHAQDGKVHCYCDECVSEVANTKASGTPGVLALNGVIAGGLGLNYIPALPLPRPEPFILQCGTCSHDIRFLGSAMEPRDVCPCVMVAGAVRPEAGGFVSEGRGAERVLSTPSAAKRLGPAGGEYWLLVSVGAKYALLMMKIGPAPGHAAVFTLVRDGVCLPVDAMLTAAVICGQALHVLRITDAWTLSVETYVYRTETNPYVVVLTAGSYQYKLFSVRDSRPRDQCVVQTVGNTNYLGDPNVWLMAAFGPPAAPMPPHRGFAIIRCTTLVLPYGWHIAVYFREPFAIVGDVVDSPQPICALCHRAECQLLDYLPRNIDNLPASIEPLPPGKGPLAGHTLLVNRARDICGHRTTLAGARAALRQVIQTEMEAMAIKQATA